MATAVLDAEGVVDVVVKQPTQNFFYTCLQFSVGDNAKISGEIHYVVCKGLAIARHSVTYSDLKTKSRA